jgi:pimeloyl-ACP methyl ester carboxylesterase
MSVNHLSYPSRSSSANNKNILVFFIPGNPGLIGFYHPFLSALRDHIDANTSFNAVKFHIYGQNLAGFTDSDHEPFTSKRKPYDLEFQIEYTLNALSNLRTESGQPYDHVLIMGHSVGAYIALEICHRVLRDPSRAPELKLTSGILLFPTIDHLAQSSNGWKLNMLRQTPLLGDNTYRIVQGFLRLWPYDTLYWFVAKILGIPPHHAEVATRWLKSRDGFWQCLHLGMDEVRVITEDIWDDELWEIAKDAKSHETITPKFYLFFGKQDHWVANHYRDQFIKKRSKQEERTRLVVDEGNIPHAFCIGQFSSSIAVAMISACYRDQKTDIPEQITAKALLKKFMDGLARCIVTADVQGLIPSIAV